MAWNFDGSSDYVSIADHAALSFPAADWAIGGWYRLGSNEDAAAEYVISWGLTANKPMFTLIIFGPSQPSLPGKSLLMCADNTTLKVLQADVGAADTAWHHLLIQRNDDVLYIFLDCTQDAVTTDVTGFGAIDVAATCYLAQFTSGSGYFHGDLAEWAKWDRALDEEEITALAYGFTPTHFRKDLAWSMPMLDFGENIAGLSITSQGATVGTHCPAIRAKRRWWSLLQPGMTRWHLDEAAIYTAGTEVGTVYTAGASAATVVT